MAFTQRDNTGALFVHDKDGVETRPDRQGSALIGGVEYWISGWIKKSKDGQTFLSLAFQQKDKQWRAKVKEEQTVGAGIDDEIPF